MARTNIYRGYSTFEFQKNKSLTIIDVDAVKLDLLNHIFTPRNSRVMMPTFGTIIPELVFEPLDEDTVSELHAEIKSAIDYDPRVEILKLNVLPDYDRNMVVVDATLRYVELNIVDDFELNIQFED